jgi:hypothetical protein
MLAVVGAGLGSARIRTNPARARWRIRRSAVIRAMSGSVMRNGITDREERVDRLRQRYRGVPSTCSTHAFAFAVMPG